jgi:formylmethanofuran dehydrogenase subunit C
MARVRSVLDAKGKDLKGASSELKAKLAEDSAIVQNAAHLHGLCGGLKSGEITIEGDSGDYLGVVNNGALITVTGNAGKYVADNMTAGAVIVEGNAGFGAAQYCYGGTAVIKGSAGDFTATMNKGATISIYVGGEWASLGHNCAVAGVESGDIKKLTGWLEEYGLEADAQAFRKITPLSDKPFYSH